MLKYFLFTISIVFSTVVYGQEKALETTSSKESFETAELLSTAGKLVKYRYQTKTALPLIQSIEIYKRLGMRPMTEAPQKTVVSDAIVETPSQRLSSVSFNVEQLTADAVKFADGDKNLLALISSLQGTRGAEDGPASYEDTIERSAIHSYSIKFIGGELAIITVNGDGSTDLDLYVYDQWGNYITKDSDFLDNCMVSFTPRRTDTYTIKVVNRGRYANHYLIATN